MKSMIRAAGLVAVASLVLVAAGIAPAGADTTISTVSGGVLQATTSGATLSNVTLTGSNMTASGNATSAWTITDARGTGAGWTLSVSASDFTSAAGTTETTPRTIPASALTITPGTITAGLGSDPAAGITAPALALSGTSQTLISVTGPNQGKGTYMLTPSFELAVPANAHRSNYSGIVGSPLIPYTATVTYTIG